MGRRSPGRPRQVETDDQILRAALELLREQGPGAVNVASVAARSGVARTTVYRRYRDREDLLTRALEPVTARGGPPEDLGVEEKVDWLLSRTEEVLLTGIGVGGVAAVLTGTDPDFSAALRRSLDRGLQPVRDQVEADRARGRLATDVDPDTLVELVLGSYLAAWLLRDGPPGRAWRDRTAHLVGTLMAPPPRT